MGQLWEDLLPKIVGKVGDYKEITRCRARLLDFDFEDANGVSHSRINLYFQNVDGDPEFPPRWTLSADRKAIGFLMSEGRPTLHFVMLGWFTYDLEEENHAIRD